MAHSHHSVKEKPVGPASKLVSLVAQFDDPDSLVAACERAREAGYRKFDAYSPFPVHGIDDAIGIRRTRLPFFVLAIAFCGCALGLVLQFYTNSSDESPIFPGYKFLISGKPFGLPGVPANIPVTFEIIVLSSAFATFFGMWILNRLPRLANPLQRLQRFRRATNDKFFLVLEAEDEKFNENRSRQQLDEWGATQIEECHLDLTDHKVPKSLRLAGIVLLFALLLPPALIYRAAGMTFRQPRLHVVPDMDWQDKFKTQTVGPNFSQDPNNPEFLFGDPRAMRNPVAGTVARGDEVAFDVFQTGYRYTDHSAAGATSAEQGAAPAAVEEDWLTEFPDGVTVSMETLERGRQRFEIYCTPCHGYDGNGNGLVNERAVALNVTGEAAWTQAKSLHDPKVKEQPVGRIFDTITNGRATMGPYRAQILPADRWAIVMYVRALQETGIQPPVTAPPADGAAAAGTN
jgi:mono/diheme cytochrome c family protein